MDYLKANITNLKQMRRNSDTVLSSSSNHLHPKIQHSTIQHLLPFNHASLSPTRVVKTTSIAAQSITPQSPLSPSVSLNSQSPVSPSSPSPSLKSNKSLLNQKLFNLVNKIPSEQRTLQAKNKSRNLSVSSSSTTKTMFQCFQNINNKIRKRHSVSILKLNAENTPANCSIPPHAKTIYSSNSKLDSAYSHLSYQTLNLANVPNLLVTHMKSQPLCSSSSTPPGSPYPNLREKYKKSFVFKNSLSSKYARRCKRSKSAPINKPKRSMSCKYSSNEIISSDATTLTNNLNAKLNGIADSACQLIACKYCDRKFEAKEETRADFTNWFVTQLIIDFFFYLYN